MVQSRNRIRRVALLVEWSRAYGRGVLRGIGRYVQAHGRWKVYHTERKLSDAAPPWLKHWEGDGIIARIENRKLAEQIKRLRIPVVNLFEHEHLNIPSVLTDNRAIARMAAEHLIERGMTHFAYCGLPGVYDEREHFFVDHLARDGHTVHVYAPSRKRSDAMIDASESVEIGHEESIARWLRALPKPVGLMACNDLRAHQVLMVCADNNLAVPEEVAVIGVDNDEAICSLTHPSLSSVEQCPEDAGYQAAALLDRLMQGNTKPRGKIVVAPRGVVARQSTDIVAIADPDVAAALRYIREHVCDGISVNNVLAHVAMSRRTLERRFLALLGRSPKDEIARVQLGHVMRLLSMTDYPLAKIAQLTGFQYVGSMCVLFKNATGQTPGQYRQNLRASGTVRSKSK